MYTITILPLLPHRLDLNHISATFDMDDVLWPSIDVVYQKLNIDLAKHHTFNIQHNRYLTPTEKSSILQALRDKQTYTNIAFYPATEKLRELYNLDIHVRINSNSSTQEIADLKRDQLLSAIPFLTDADLTLKVVSEDHATRGKQIGQEITFFIDDSPYNIAASEACCNLLPRKTWNTNPEEQSRMQNKNFYILDGLDSIIETIIRSVHFWRKSYRNL